MEFKGIKARWWRLLGGACCAGLVALAACGGGSQVEKFHPTRAISFGDENSVVVPNATTPVQARRYSVNGLDTATSTTVDCTTTALWNEDVASAFQLSFQACPRAGTSATGLIFAAPKAKVADVATQIDNFLATQPGFSHADVVTVMAGMYDILEQFALYPATPEATLIETVKQRGKALAQQINRIATADAPVIVMRVPHVGLTPYAISQGADAGALLNRLTDAFNTEMQLNLINDGHLVGLVFGDTVIQNLVTINTLPTNTAPINVTNAMCQQAVDATDKLDDSVLLNCTTSTLIQVNGTMVTDAGYLWAGNLMLGPIGHQNLGSEAVARALNNPF